MRYVKVAEMNELAPGNKKKITLDSREILLANLDSGYYAIDNTCPHMGGSLSEGKLEGKNIICPKHGAIFDVTTGKAVKNGKMLFITAKVHDLASYPVRVDVTGILLGIE